MDMQTCNERKMYSLKIKKSLKRKCCQPCIQGRKNEGKAKKVRKRYREGLLLDALDGLRRMPAENGGGSRKGATR
jgi:hypothetical protein